MKKNYHDDIWESRWTKAANILAHFIDTLYINSEILNSMRRASYFRVHLYMESCCSELTGDEAVSLTECSYSTPTPLHFISREDTLKWTDKSNNIDRVLDNAEYTRLQ